MTLTINTDASFHPKFGVGAYAFWIKWTDGKLVQSGALKQVKNSQDAEMQAIGNALYAVLQKDFKELEHIYINTDCKYGIEAITKGKKINGCLDTVKQVNRYVSKLAVKYQEYYGGYRRFKKLISWRYVPAHTSGATKRTWVNNKMDELAKAALWQSINNKNEKQ